MDEITKHINENECGRWTCCENALKIQEKKEHRKRIEQDVEGENNKEREIEENTPENKEKYKKEDEKTSTIKEPDIDKGLIENK